MAILADAVASSEHLSENSLRRVRNLRSLPR